MADDSQELIFKTMLKLSFKNSDRNPYKTVSYFNGKVTLCSLIGTATLPLHLMRIIPVEVMLWAEKNKAVDVDINVYGNIRIKATGKASLSPNDTFSATIGGRIAEARAKVKMYRFMASFIVRIQDYFSKVLYGNQEIYTMKPATEGLMGDALKYKILMVREELHLSNLISHAGTKST